MGTRFQIVFCLVAGSLVLVLAEPELTTFPKSDKLLVPNNSALELICKVVDSQTIEKTELVWNKHGSSSTIQSNYKDGTEGGKNFVTNTLTFAKFDSVQDVGKYTCKYKGSSSAIELKALEEAENNKDQEYKYDNDEKDIELECSGKFNNKAADTVKWFKNGKSVNDLKDKERFEKNTDGAKNKLKIMDVTREDADVYSAELKFDSGDVYNCQVALKAEPLVLDLDTSINLHEEERLELDCVAYGYPKPNITWYKDDEKVDSDGTVDDHAKFVKLSVKPEDAGKYTCRACADETEVKDMCSKTIIVRIKDQYEALWPFLGIVVECILLAAIIFVCNQRQKRALRAE